MGSTRMLTQRTKTCPWGPRVGSARACGSKVRLPTNPALLKRKALEVIGEGDGAGVPVANLSQRGVLGFSSQSPRH